MELGLSLGDPPKPLGFIEKHRDQPPNEDKAPAFCMDLSIGPLCPTEDNGREDEPDELTHKEHRDENNGKSGSSSSEVPPVQLDLLPHAPVPRSHGGFPWSENHGVIFTKMPFLNFIFFFKIFINSFFFFLTFQRLVGMEYWS